MPKKEFKSSDVKDRKEQQQLQLLLSVFIAAAVTIAWAAGKFTSISTSGYICLTLLILVFTVWNRKSRNLLERTIKAAELNVHQKKAIRNEETVEWLNFLLNRWWTFSEASLFEIFKMNLDPVFEYAKPGFIDTMELVEFSFGRCTPCVKFAKAFEDSRNKNSKKEPKEEDGVVQNLGNHFLVLDLEILLSAPDASVVIKVRLGGKWLGAEVDVAVEDLSLSGRVQVLVELDHQAPFPHMKAVSITFLEKPDVGFDVRMLKALQVMDIPLVKDFINSLVMESLTVAIVDPEQIYIPLYEGEGEKNTQGNINTSHAIGVLTITFEGGTDDQPNDESVSLTLQLDDQERTMEISKMNTSKKETKSCSILVYDLNSDKCIIEMKGRRSLGTKFVIAKHKLSLKKLNLKKTPETSTVLEKQGVKGSRLDLNLIYTELQQIEIQNQLQDEFLKDYDVNGPVDEVSGVVFVYLHKGSNLLSMDSDGYSDPYCIITANQRRVKTTEHIPNTINPVWDSFVEFPVKDFSQIILSFLVYDRDSNWQSKSDDFMGSCNLRLSLDTKVVIRQNVELLYKVFGEKNSEDIVVKAGSVCVSVVFRPIASASLSEALFYLSCEGANDGEDLVGVNIKGKPHTAKTISKSRKRLGDLLLRRERGALMLSILKASDLVAMDKNGLSDPFCIVLVDDKKKFKTEVVKENLEPEWNESFSMPMLTLDEKLNINVYDKDVITNDFMGKVSLTMAEIVEAAQQEAPVWFTLDETESGKIQLKFQIQSSDSQVEDVKEAGGNDGLCDKNDDPCDENDDTTNIENTVDMFTESEDEEIANKIPEILYNLSGKIIQAELEGPTPVSAKVILEILRKGRLRGSIRRKFESFTLLKTDPTPIVEGEIKWNAVFKAADNMEIPKESLLSIELKSNTKKHLFQFSFPLVELMKDDLKYSHQKGCYILKKWLPITSERNGVAKVNVMIIFSDSPST